ncbi:MAG: V-type ATP synthase subunit D [Proteobacteria bacterium]|nr:V-type ATP synthase subunit D [Pseudomonadota bacterium]
MAGRIKLNKVSLREQKKKLGMFQRFLPTLEARKQQLLMQLTAVREKIKEQQIDIDNLLKEISSWSRLYWGLEKDIRFFVRIKEVEVTIRNVAGLKVPYFAGVVFEDMPYSIFATPYSLDEVIEKTRRLISFREALKILKEQEEALNAGFIKTSQRINLYEQRLIPDCRRSIRKISVHLQDQQASSVGVAKVAKRLTREALDALARGSGLNI